MTGETTAMSALLAQLALVADKVLAFIADVCTTIVGQPLLLMSVGFLFIGGVVGIFGRLLSRN